MYFLLFGEGSSDLGYSIDNPGPLVTALEHLAQEVSTETLVYDYVQKSRLQTTIKNHGSRKKMLLRGNKRKHSYLITIQKYAMGLGLIAMETDNCGIVFFHDCDYTHSEVNDPDKYYRQLVMCMERGFAQAQNHSGVAMVPKPRSESWFLCHYQDTPYHNCERFEDLPANDAAEGSGKKLLAQHFKCSENEIYQHVDPGAIDWGRIDAPSFLFFKTRFQHVIQRLTGQPTTVSEPETLMTATT